jgi:CheY-like chemotaxis protein
MVTGTAMKKILIADDEPRLRLLVRLSLEEDGCTVLEAGNGEEALRLVRDEKPDLVILDVAMPGIYGTEVCERLRSNPKTSRIPVILLTAHHEQKPTTQADFWWTKPFSPVDLRRLVQRILGERP